MKFEEDAPQYRAMLLKSEVSKVHTGLSIQSNVTHFIDVKSSPLYTRSIRDVMLCVERRSKWFNTSLLITFLIFNQFPIRKFFGKLRLRAFQPSNTIYVGGVKGYFNL